MNEKDKIVLCIFHHHRTCMLKDGVEFREFRAFIIVPHPFDVAISRGRSALKRKETEKMTNSNHRNCTGCEKDFETF